MFPNCFFVRFVLETLTLTASPSPRNVAHSSVVKLLRTQRCAAYGRTSRGANTSAPRSIFEYGDKQVQSERPD